MAELNEKLGTDAAGRRVKRPGEPPLANYAEKQPTDLQKRFAEWIEEKTGVKPDLNTVALAVNLRMVFQRSEENQVFVKASRERAAASREARAAKASGRPAKSEEPKRRRPKPEVEAQDEPQPEAPLPANNEAPAEPDLKPEPMFDDDAADKAVADSQKKSVAKKPRATAVSAKPRARRTSKDANRDLVD